MSYERRGDMIISDYRLDSGNVIYVTARDIRRERTGPHAKLSIAIDDLALEWDVLNVERREDRVRLANAAWKKLGAVDQKCCSQNRMAAIIHAFCGGLFDAFMAGNRGTMLSGGTEITPIEFYHDPFIQRGGGTIIYSPPGGGKTYTAIIFQRCIEFALSQFWKVREARCLFVQLERSEYSFARRLQLVNRALGLAPETPMLSLCRRGVALVDLKDVIRRHVEEDGVELVFLDSISRAGAGSLVEDRTANTVMDTLNLVAPSYCALAHLSHDGKDQPGKSHVFGSIHFEAAADIVVQLTSQRQGDTLGIAMQVTKTNDGGDRSMHMLALDFDPAIGLSGIRAPKMHEFPELNADRRMSNADKLFEYTLEKGRATATGAAADLTMPRQKAAEIYRHDVRFVAVVKEGREQFYGVRHDRS